MKSFPTAKVSGNVLAHLELVAQVYTVVTVEDFTTCGQIVVMYVLIDVQHESLYPPVFVILGVLLPACRSAVAFWPPLPSSRQIKASTTYD